jgi:hypothetical protein
MRVEMLALGCPIAKFPDSLTEILVVEFCWRNVMTRTAGNSGQDVPLDFPRRDHLGALPGAQPKLLAVLCEGKFYTPGSTPPELRARWEFCADFADQLAVHAYISKAGKRSHMCEQDILQHYLDRLNLVEKITAAEARWIIFQVASILKWPVAKFPPNQFP